MPVGRRGLCTGRPGDLSGARRRRARLQRQALRGANPDGLHRQLRTVDVIPLTSSPRALAPLIVPVPSDGKANFMALCHQIRTIDKTRIGKLLGALSVEDMACEWRDIAMQPLPP